MTEKEYRAHPAISRSDLWRLRESPEKFRYYMGNPPEPTPALIFGQAVHKLLLQPEGFDAEFAVMPDIDRRTKAGREAYEAFLEESEGKTVITAADYEKAAAMVEKCLAAPFVEQLLSGAREEPIFWTDELTGEKCKCRPDALTEIGEDLVIADYKTCTDASTDAFMKDAFRYGYHLQAAMYSEGVLKTTGRMPLFVFIAQEKSPPYAVNVMQADNVMTDYGYDVFWTLMGLYHRCKESGKWYGYNGRDDVINNLSLPAWAVKGE